MLNPIGLPEAGQQQRSSIVAKCHDSEIYVYAHDLYKLQARVVGDLSPESWVDLSQYNYLEMDSASARLFVNRLNVLNSQFVHRAVLVLCRADLSISVGGQL